MSKVKICSHKCTRMLDQATTWSTIQKDKHSGMSVCKQKLWTHLWTLFDKYLYLVVGLKGREKYASLQVHWMELLRSPPLFFLCALARVYKLLLVPSPHPAFCHLLSALSWVGPRYNTHISTCLCTHPSRQTLTLRCVSDVPTVTLCSWATPAVSLPCSDSCLHNQNRGDETH